MKRNLFFIISNH